MKRGLIRGLMVMLFLSGAPAPVLAAEADEAERQAARQALEEARAELERARQTLREAARTMAEAYGDLDVRTPGAYAYSFVSDPRKAMLGVVLESDARGLEVIGLTPGGPAEEAGLQVGDILVSINGQNVMTGDKGELGVVLDVLDELEVGDEARVTFLRDGDEQEVTVVAERREPFMWHSVIDGDLDFQFSDAVDEFETRLSEMEIDVPDMRFLFSPDQNVVVDRVLRYTGLHELELVTMNEGLGDYFGTNRGVLVLNAPEENAWGLRAGDVILSVDGREISSPSDAWRILRSYEPGESVDLRIYREHVEQTLAAVVPERSAGFGPGFSRKVEVHVARERKSEDEDEDESEE